MPGDRVDIEDLESFIDGLQTSFDTLGDVDPKEALRMSRKTISGNFGQILLLCLVLGGINFLGLLTFGIGILLTFPFSYCVVYAAFDDIIGIPK